jgi:hypothetical protein
MMLGRACVAQVARRGCVAARGGALGAAPTRLPLAAQAAARGLPSARALLVAYREQTARALSSAAAAAPGGAKKLEGRCEWLRLGPGG